MHHYLGADNVPSTETYCGGAMGFKDGRRDVERRRPAPARRAARPGAGRAARSSTTSRSIRTCCLTLHPDYMVTVTHLAADARSHAPRQRVALPPGRDRPAWLRLRGRRRVLGRHQSRGLGDLRAIAAGHLLTRLHAWPVLEPRDAVVGVRSVRPVARRAEEHSHRDQIGPREAARCTDTNSADTLCSVNSTVPLHAGLSVRHNVAATLAQSSQPPHTAPGAGASGTAGARGISRCVPRSMSA